MPEPRNIGTLRHISAEALGRPGQRRFRLRAISGEGESAALWLEKEQLAALGEAIETVLDQEAYAYERQPLDDAEAEPVFPGIVDVEMRVGQLSMGVDRGEQRIVLIVAEAADDEEEAAGVTMDFDYRRGYELRRQIAEVVAAGRPPCPLCGGPLDPDGHVCPRTNGHHKN